MGRLLLAILVLLAAGQTANATDWYVNNVSGDDRKDGLSEASRSATSGPLLTIRKALRRASHRDRIIIANTGEPYRESVTLCGRHSGTPESPFTIIGNGAVLDGSLPVPADVWEFDRGETFRFQPARLSAAQQLFLDGRPLVKGPAPTAAGNVPPLAPLQWRYLEGQIQFCPEKDKLPSSYPLSYAAQSVGITLYQVMHVEISDLVLQGYQLDGLNAHDSAFYVDIKGVTARGNGRSGISIGGASRVTLEGCLVGNNGQAQVRTEGWSHSKLVNCSLLENTAPALVQTEKSQVESVEIKDE